MQITIPSSTILKLAAFGLLFYFIYQLWPLIMLIILALLVAVALEPAVALCERKIPRWAALLVAAAGLGLFFLVVVALIAPPLFEQATAVIEKAPTYFDQLLRQLPSGGAFGRVVKKTVDGGPPNIGPALAQILEYGQIAMGGLSSIILVYVLAIYLLVDGKGTWEWLLAFFNTEDRVRLDRTANELAPIVSAYVIGQVITSLLCGLYVFAVLSALQVPATLMLAVLAAIFDVLPILGFILSLVPALIFAFTVSPQTAIFVLGLYATYHAIENYWIVPKIYGSRMRLSGLTVLVTFLVAVALGGIVGAIAALPIAAAYPIIERIWLARWVGRETVRKHRDDQA